MSFSKWLTTCRFIGMHYTIGEICEHLGGGKKQLCQHITSVSLPKKMLRRLLSIYPRDRINF